MTEEPTKDLASLVDEDRKQRINATAREIEAVLTKYNCSLVPVVNIRGGSLQQSIDIVSRV